MDANLILFKIINYINKEKNTNKRGRQPNLPKKKKNYKTFLALAWRPL